MPLSKNLHKEEKRAVKEGWSIQENCKQCCKRQEETTAAVLLGEQFTIAMILRLKGHQNHQKALFKQRESWAQLLEFPIQQFWVGPKNYISNKFPGHAQDIVHLRTYFENQCPGENRGLVLWLSKGTADGSDNQQWVTVSQEKSSPI